MSRKRKNTKRNTSVVMDDYEALLAAQKTIDRLESELAKASSHNLEEVIHSVRTRSTALELAISSFSPVSQPVSTDDVVTRARKFAEFLNEVPAALTPKPD